MKRVLLLRHAKSSWSDETLTDHERPLSSRGIRDAKRMAVYFEDKLLTPDYVLCSSATRARKTYALLAKRFKNEPELVVDGALYLPTPEALLQALRAVPEHAKSVLVVGHSPSLDALLLRCMSKSPSEARARISEKLPTGALCWLELNSASFRELGEKPARIAAFVTPADLDPDRSPRQTRAVRAGRISLRSKASVREAASLVLDDCITQMRANAGRLQHDDAPELVHQLRVGIRRLRVAIRVFDSVLELSSESPIEASLKWLFRELGPIRERDVFLRDVVEPAIHVHAQPALVSLQKRLLIERHAMLADARKVLTSQRFLTLLREVLSLAAKLDTAEDTGRLESWASKRLEHRLSKVLALEPAIEKRDPALLHLLRRELKKLRYTAEFVAGAFSEKRSKAYLKRLSALLDVLGALNDVAVGERLLGHGLKRLKAGRARTHTREALRTIFDGVATESALSLPQSFAAFKQQKPFWL